MKIQQFSQLGKRSNNEDCIGYSAGLLTVCDGMGGHNFGERASAFVKEAMLQAFAEPAAIGKMEIQQQLNKVQADINQLLEKEPELEKMGTTFTGVFITPDVWYAAHIGDSRIYLFRPSEQKLWHTWDHSLVGELMRTKEITVEAGRFHPMSNRISKAIIAQKDGKAANASIVKIDELKPGDIFLLCSDGVVEGWGDFELVQLFSDNSLSFEQKCKKLAQQCDLKSKDNNTALIAEIEEKDAFSYGNNAELEWTSFAAVAADYQQYLKDNAEDESEQDVKQQPATTPTNQAANQENVAAGPADKGYKEEPNDSGSKRWIFIVAIFVAILAGVLVWWLFLKDRTPNENPPANKVEIQIDSTKTNTQDTVTRINSDDKSLKEVEGGKVEPGVEESNTGLKESSHDVEGADSEVTSESEKKDPKTDVNAVEPEGDKAKVEESKEKTDVTGNEGKDKKETDDANKKKTESDNNQETKWI